MLSDPVDGRHVRGNGHTVPRSYTAEIVSEIHLAKSHYYLVGLRGCEERCGAEGVKSRRSIYSHNLAPPHSPPLTPPRWPESGTAPSSKFVLRW